MTRPAEVYQWLPGSGVFRGIVQGDARVASGSNVDVKGIVMGDLLVETGAIVHVSGIVKGGIIDEGATIAVSGIVG